jgi:hypothetical protein
MFHESRFLKKIDAPRGDMLNCSLFAAIARHHTYQFYTICYELSLFDLLLACHVSIYFESSKFSHQETTNGVFFDSSGQPLATNDEEEEFLTSFVIVTSPLHTHTHGCNQASYDLHPCKGQEVPRGTEKADATNSTTRHGRPQ